MNYEKLVKAVYPDAICTFDDPSPWIDKYVIRLPNESGYHSYLSNWNLTHELAWKNAWEIISDKLLEKLES
jgi:hypothetical protein